MAKKTLGYVELEWTCPACQARNPGSKKSCQNCGAAMPENMKFELPAQQALDTSAETAARVGAGPDIHCPYCGARNRGDAKACSQCGGDLTQGLKRAGGEVLGAHTTGPAPELTCPHCGAKNPGTALKCSQCGGTLAQPKPPSAPPAPRKGGNKTLLVLGVLALLVICGLFAIISRLAGKSSTAIALVKDVQWTYSIELEALGPVTKEDWRDKVPAGAKLGNCTQKVRRTESNPMPGATEVCGTPYVQDTGTGKGKVVQDCKYQVTDAWCQYTVNEWRSAGHETATGRDPNPKWPALSLRTDQRERGRSEAYKVVFDNDGKQYTYSPKDLQEFTRFKPGSKWNLEISGLGGIKSVKPAD